MMTCSFCKTEVDPADLSAAALARWEQVTAHTFRGGALLLLQAHACGKCAPKLVPGSVALVLVNQEKES